VRPSLTSGRQHSRDEVASLPILLPTPPALPGRILPEFAVPCLDAFDHPDFRFSIEWDGSRTLLFTSSDGVRLQSETLADVGDRYPEIVAAAAALADSDAVLDGVVAVLDPSGCPDLPALGERMALGPSTQHRLPTVYLANDLLHLHGRPTTGLPLDRRLELLHGLGDTSARIQVPDWVAGEGEALAEAARGRRLPALLARHADARYHPGVASNQRLLIPLRHRANCVVVAAERLAVGRGRRRRLRLAERVGSRLEECGAVEVDETSVLWRWAAPGGRLRAPLVATVEHRGRSAGGSIRHAELVILRDDVDANWCVKREPVPPPPGRPVAAVGFHPTVLAALPLDLPPAG